MNKTQIAVLGLSVVAFGAAYVLFNSGQELAPSPIIVQAAPKVGNRGGACCGTGRADGDAGRGRLGYVADLAEGRDFGANGRQIQRPHVWRTSRGR